MIVFVLCIYACYKKNEFAKMIKDGVEHDISRFRL